MTPCRGFLALALTLAVLLLPAGAQPSLEYQVKAAYLTKLSPFVEWPDNAFPNPTAPLFICVFGPDPFGAVLDRAAEGQKDREHPLAVRRIAANEPIGHCNILFVSDPALVQRALAQVAGRPVLTVVDSGRPAGGMINFVIIRNNVRFDIDAAAAESVGLRFSSKLLALARNVRQGAR